MIGGSPIGLAGCGIWLFFALIFGIWAENRGGKRELQLRAGAGFRVFMGLGCGIRKRKSAGYRISILKWPHKLLLTSVPRSFLVFLVFRPSPERLVCFGQDGHTEWPRLWFTERYELRHHILWKGIPSFGKESSEARFQGKRRRWKLWKRLFSLFTGPASSWIWEWTIFFFHFYVNKRKRNRFNIGDRDIISPFKTFMFERGYYKKANKKTEICCHKMPPAKSARNLADARKKLTADWPRSKADVVSIPSSKSLKRNTIRFNNFRISLF